MARDRRRTPDRTRHWRLHRLRSPHYRSVTGPGPTSSTGAVGEPTSTGRERQPGSPRSRHASARAASASAARCCASISFFATPSASSGSARAPPEPVPARPARRGPGLRTSRRARRSAGDPRQVRAALQRASLRIPRDPSDRDCSWSAIAASREAVDSPTWAVFARVMARSLARAACRWSACSSAEPSTAPRWS